MGSRVVGALLTTAMLVSGCSESDSAPQAQLPPAESNSTDSGATTDAPLEDERITAARQQLVAEQQSIREDFADDGRASVQVTLGSCAVFEYTQPDTGEGMYAVVPHAGLITEEASDGGIIRQQYGYNRWTGDVTFGPLDILYSDGTLVVEDREGGGMASETSYQTIVTVDVEADTTSAPTQLMPAKVAATAALDGQSLPAIVRPGHVADQICQAAVGEI